MSRLGRVLKRGEHVKRVFLLYVSSDLEAAIPEAIGERGGRPWLDIDAAIGQLFTYPDQTTFRRWVDGGRRLQLVNERTFTGLATIGIEDKLETFTSRSAMASRMFVEGQVVRPADEWGEHVYCIPPIDPGVRVSLAVAGELVDHPADVICVKWGE